MSTIVVHIIASINTTQGGPSRSVPGLCDALSACDIDVILVSQKTASECDDDLITPVNQRIKTHLIDSHKRFGQTCSPGYFKQVSAIITKEKGTIVHSHGIWLQCNRQAALCAQRLNLPHIVSTRGMLEPWALSHNSWKKKPVWFLWQKQALRQATAFCATSDQEAETIRALGFRQPVAIIPNGVNFTLDTKQTGSHRTTRVALFLSRIHPKKGLSNLVNAWSQVRPPGWKVVIAGPDENGHLAEIQHEIEILGLDNCFEFIGVTDGAEKERLYREADIFILPTFSENFGIVVAEALVAGVPVITTKGTPWQDLVTHNCGWWVDIGVKPLADALRHATALSDTQLATMGQNGREYVVSRFGWKEIGQKMAAFYDWVLNGGRPPDYVRID